MATIKPNDIKPIGMRMDRYALQNAIHIVDGYYRPPSPSNHYEAKSTVEDRFESAKKTALFHLQKRMDDVNELTLEQFLPKYRKPK